MLLHFFILTADLQVSVFSGIYQTTMMLINNLYKSPVELPHQEQQIEKLIRIRAMTTTCARRTPLIDSSLLFYDWLDATELKNVLCTSRSNHKTLIEWIEAKVIHKDCFKTLNLLTSFVSQLSKFGNEWLCLTDDIINNHRFFLQHISNQRNKIKATKEYIFILLSLMDVCDLGVNGELEITAYSDMRRYVMIFNCHQMYFPVYRQKTDRDFIHVIREYVISCGDYNRLSNSLRDDIATKLIMFLKVSISF